MWLDDDAIAVRNAVGKVIVIFGGLAALMGLSMFFFADSQSPIRPWDMLVFSAMFFSVGIPISKQTGIKRKPNARDLYPCAEHSDNQEQ